MKWDMKHDRAKRVLNHFLDNAGYWTEVGYLAEGLSKEEIEEVCAELGTMIQSITKRYKLDVLIEEESKPENEVQAEAPAEEPSVENDKAEEEKPLEKPKRHGRRRTKKAAEKEEAIA